MYLSREDISTTEKAQFYYILFSVYIPCELVEISSFHPSLCETLTGSFICEALRGLGCCFVGFFLSIQETIGRVHKRPWKFISKTASHYH